MIELIEKAVAYVDKDGQPVLGEGSEPHFKQARAIFNSIGDAVAKAQVLQEYSGRAEIDEARKANGVARMVPIFDVYKDGIFWGVVKANGEYVEV